MWPNRPDGTRPSCRRPAHPKPQPAAPSHGHGSGSFREPRWDEGLRADRHEEGPRPPSLPSPWAPAAGALARGPLLLLALSLGPAGAQRTLAEVPIQPGFDAQKVTVLVRPQTWPWGKEVGASVPSRPRSGARRCTKGEAGDGSGISGPGTTPRCSSGSCPPRPRGLPATGPGQGGTWSPCSV